MISFLWCCPATIPILRAGTIQPPVRWPAVIEASWIVLGGKHGLVSESHPPSLNGEQPLNCLTSTTGPGNSDLFEEIALAIESRGYIILPAALSAGLTDSLYLHLKGLDLARFKQARIGRDGQEMGNPFIRSDRILWVDGEQNAVADYLAWMERLRLAVNRRLFLGLFDYECHFAYYARGTFYKKHYDAFRGERNRVLTTVYYLNPNWQPLDGGQLQIYSPEDGALMETVQPCYGQMVIFLSERFPHEVVPAQRERYSMAGWFRVNTCTLSR